MADQQNSVPGGTKRRPSWLMNSPKPGSTISNADNPVLLLEPDSSALKRQKTAEVEVEKRNKASSFFSTEYTAEYSQKLLEDIENGFLQKNTGLSRAEVADLPFHIIEDEYIILQLTESRGKCIFQGENRWRLLAREIHADGTRGSRVYFQISSYLPEMEKNIPSAWNGRLEWSNAKLAPIVLVNGFTKLKDKFMNPEWKASLLCDASSTPRIFCGILKTPTEKRFISDFGDRNSDGPDTPHLPILPFAASLMSKNVSANHKDSCNASSRSELACDYVLPATSGYTRLKDLEGNTLFNIVGVIKHFQGAKPVNGGRNFMTMVTVVDPSLDVSNNEKLPCVLFSPTRDNLPDIHAIGQILIIHRLSIAYHNMQKQGKGRENDAYTFSVVDSSSLCITSTSNGTPLREGDKRIIKRLATWYGSFGAGAIAQAESELFAAPQNQLVSNNGPPNMGRPVYAPGSTVRLVDNPQPDLPQQNPVNLQTNYTLRKPEVIIAPAVAATVNGPASRVQNGRSNGDASRPDEEPTTSNRAAEVPNTFYGTAVKTLNHVAARISGEPPVRAQHGQRDNNAFCRLS